ncbi:MAG TPA: DUF975 family protein [Clostridia bacterium]|nr:DUF975 family protein [Clostridia bacterium]
MKFASDFRRAAREALVGKWGIALAVSLVAVLLGGYSGGLGFNTPINTDFFASNNSPLWVENLHQRLVSMGNLSATVFPLSLVMFILGGAVQLGHNLFYVKLMRSEGPAFETLFSRFSIFGRALGLRLFMALFIFLWSLLFVIPGIIAAYRYRMAPYLMAEHPEMGVREAMDESKRMTPGYKSRWFCLDLSFIGWGILCVFTLGIGFLWLNPYVSAASAAFYRDILAERVGGQDPDNYAYGGPERI